MAKSIIVVLLSLVVSVPLWAEQAVPSGEVVRRIAADLPAGAHVALRLADGRRIPGQLVEVRSEEVVFMPRTRLAVPASAVPFDQIEGIDRINPPGMSPGTKVAIAVGSVAGGVLLAALIAFAAVGY